MDGIYVSRRKSILLLINVFAIFIIIEPVYLSRFAVLNIINLILKIAIGLCVLFYYFVVKRKLRPYFVLIACFELSLLLSTFLNAGSLNVWFRKGAYVLLLALFMEIMIDIDSRTLLKALSIVLGMYVHINLLTRIVYPSGLYVSELEGYTNCWFLGYDNLAAIIIILSQTVALFRILVSKGKMMIWDKTVIISGVVFIFWQQIATGILAECLLFLYCIFVRIHAIGRIIGKAKIIVIGMFVVFILIQFFNVQQGELITMIFGLLGKNTTFTGRAFFWQKAWKDIISGGSLWGFGVQDPMVYVKKFGYVACTHLHCNYLQVLYEGGLIGEILLFLMLYYPACRFDNRRKRYASMIFLGGLMAVMLIWQVEAYTTVITYFIIALTLLNYSDKIERNAIVRDENSQTTGEFK